MGGDCWGLLWIVGDCFFFWGCRRWLGITRLPTHYEQGGVVGYYRGLLSVVGYFFLNESEQAVECCWVLSGMTGCIAYRITGCMADCMADIGHEKQHKSQEDGLFSRKNMPGLVGSKKKSYLCTLNTYTHIQCIHGAYIVHSQCVHNAWNAYIEWWLHGAWR